MQTTISLGKPIMAPALVPVLHQSTPECIDSPFVINGECYGVTAMSFGAPYGAVVVDDINHASVKAIGHALSTHPLFPEGANIVFIQMLDESNLEACCFEKNTGEAVSSPEAAGVAATTAMILQKTLEHEVNVSIGKKMFQVEWDRCDGEVFCRDKVI